MLQHRRKTWTHAVNSVPGCFSKHCDLTKVTDSSNELAHSLTYRWRAARIFFFFFVPGLCAATSCHFSHLACWASAVHPSFLHAPGSFTAVSSWSSGWRTRSSLQSQSCRRLPQGEGFLFRTPSQVLTQLVDSRAAQRRKNQKDVNFAVGCRQELGSRPSSSCAWSSQGRQTHQNSCTWS